MWTRTTRRPWERSDWRSPAACARFQDRERERLTGNRHVGPVVGGDLDVDAGVRTPFMELAGAVQETRAKNRAWWQDAVCHGWRHAGARARFSLPPSCVDVGHQRDVVPWIGGVEVRGERARGAASE